jgi:hypothetical protein
MNSILTLAAFLQFLILSFSLAGQSKESLEYMGKLKPRHAREIQSSLISVGAEIELERVIDKYSSRIVVRQGEAGCPSQKSDMFAMKNQDWNELQQAKHILRRLMYDLARGKETSIFTIIDARYEKNTFKSKFIGIINCIMCFNDPMWFRIG